MEQTIVDQFYQAFSEKDWSKMQACYHQDVTFTDPAFGTLKGDDARKMWRMLCEQGKDLKITYSTEKVSDNQQKGHWEAWYTFSKTGKKVHNVIDANFEIKDGLIYRHVDQFNIHKWASQALGFQGWLLGGTQFFKRKFQEQAKKSLDKYQAK